MIQATIDGLIDEARGESVSLTLRLQEGVPFDNQIKAPAFQSKNRTVVFGDEIKIKDVFLKEDSSGFYFHVVCDDESVPGERDFYNLHSYSDDFRDISPRCVPDFESARNRISFSPTRDFQIGPVAGGFLIRGDFARGDYKLQIEPGLRSVDGGITGNLYEKDFEVGPREPTISLEGQGRYVPKQSWTNLGISHRNIDAVRLRIRYLPEKNLTFWLSGHDDDIDSRTANRVVDKIVSVKGPKDEVAKTFLDLSDHLEERRRGAYEINVKGLKKRGDKEGSNKEDSYRSVGSDTRRLVLTNINLVAKREQPKPGQNWSDRIHIWATGLESLKPRSGVTVEAIQPSGFGKGECVTNADGFCTLKVDPKKTEPSEPFALIAKTENDLTFLEFSDLRTENPSGGASGRPYQSEDPYNVALYSERDLYRPGREVRIAGIVRQPALEKVDSELPVKVKLIDSRNRLVREKVVETNKVGAFEFRHKTGNLASTGKWRLVTSIGGTKLETYEFFVEEFVPERIDLSVEPKRKHIEAGEKLRVQIDAKYLFGAPAAESRAQLRCTAEQKNFTPPGLESYHFGRASYEKDHVSGRSRRELTERTIKLNKKGEGSMACPTDNLPRGSSAKISAHVSFSEAGSGRSTSEQTSGWVHPDNHLIGLRANKNEVEEGDTLKVNGVISDWMGDKVGHINSVNVEFITVDRNYYRDEYQWRPTVINEKEFTVTNGEFSFETKIGAVEEAFAVRVRAGDAVTTLQLDSDRGWYYSYWRYRHHRGGEHTPSPEMPSEVPIDVNGPIRAGQNFDVQFKAPFEGRAIVTVETHELKHQVTKRVEAGPHTINLPLDGFSPNVYVSVFMTKDPHIESETAFSPGRAFGVESVRVDDQRYREAVEISTAGKVKPKSKLSVDIETGFKNKPAYVTVAAVDEGILQLTDFKSPDPLRDFLAKRSLGVETFDTVGWNARMSLGATPSGGGRSSNRETEPPGPNAKRPSNIEPVAKWSGLVPIDESGDANVEFEIPDFRGELRVMAVAIGSERIGSSVTPVKVRQPLGVQATTPRFLSNGDAAEILVFLTNQTGRSQDVRIKANVSSASRFQSRRTPIVLNGKNKRRVTLKNGESKRLRFRVRGRFPTGRARFRVEAKAESHRASTEKTFPLQSPKPTEQTLKLVELESGKTDLTPYLKGWVKGSETTTFRLSQTQVISAIEKLNWLIDYPYGCLKQTTSSTRPLLYLKDLLTLTDSPSGSGKSKDVGQMLEEGIDRILSMQTTSGGLSYWPGSNRAVKWGTAYAVELLIDAQSRGYSIPGQRINEAIDWLKRRVVRDDAYELYVLAKAGEADRSKIRRGIERLDEDDVSGSRAEKLYLLKAALYLTGDRRYESDLKNMSKTLSTEDGDESYSGTFYSPLRRKGFVFSIYQDLFGGDEGLGRKHIEQFARQIRQDDHLKTQEGQWAITAIGKWLKERTVSQSKLEEAKLLANGEVVAPLEKSSDSKPSRWRLKRASERKSLALKTKMEEGNSWYLTIKSEGIRKNPTVDYTDNGISVRRRYVDSKGRRLDLDEIGLGELFFASISVENLANRDLENIAIVDRLPAGLEVENPRFSDSPSIVERLVGDRSFDTHTHSWWYDHINIRDDRIRVFGDLHDHQKGRKVVYALRATLPGEFVQPPVKAHAMYAPEIVSRQKGRKIVVSGNGSGTSGVGSGESADESDKSKGGK